MHIACQQFLVLQLFSADLILVLAQQQVLKILELFLALEQQAVQLLQELLKQVEIITNHKSHGAVKLGSTVTLTVNGKKESFMLVGEWEADPKDKKISHESPLGKALIGKKVGEKVEVEAPAGKILYIIQSIS